MRVLRLCLALFPFWIKCTMAVADGAASPVADAGFMGNRGRYPDEVRYFVSGARGTAFLVKSGIVFRLFEPAAEGGFARTASTKIRQLVFRLPFPGPDQLCGWTPLVVK